MSKNLKIILILVLSLTQITLMRADTVQLENKPSDNEIKDIDDQVAIEKQKALNEAVEMIKKGKELASNSEFEEAETEFNNAKEKINALGGDNAELKLKQLLAYLVSFRMKWEQSLMNEAYAAFGDKNYDVAVIKAREAQSIDELPENRKAKIQIFVELCEKRMDSLVFKEKTALTYKDVDPDNKTRKYEIDVAMKNADTLIKNKQYTRARDSLEKILVRDPYNFKATEKLKRLYKKLISVGIERKRSDLLERVSEVQWKWNEPVLPVPAKRPDRAETIKEVDGGGLAEKLSRLVLPGINFEDADIQSIIKFLKHESKRIDTIDGTGINIVLGIDESETATVPHVDLVLENVPMNEAIRYLCQMCNLKYRIDEQVLTIGNESIDSMDTRFFKVRSALITRIAPAAEGEEEGAAFEDDDFFSTEDTLGADVDDLTSRRSVTSEALRVYFKDRGIPFPEESTIAYSRRSGKLTVKNTHENLRRLDTLLRALDVEQPQVLIETKFIEINQTDLEEMGFEWWINPIARGDHPREWVINQGDTLVRPTGANADGVNSPVSNTQSRLVNDFVFPVFNDISSKIPKLELHMILHAVDQSRNSEVLSAPKVIAKNGEEANIRMVREEYYPDTYSAPELVIVNGLFQYTPPIPEFSEATDVGISLTVTPTVSPDNHTISLALNPQVIQLTGWTDYSISYIFGANSGTSPVNMAERSRRDINVNVKTYDGDTLVIGGMLTETASDNDDQYPGTDKIPLLGFLGRVQSSNSTKRNLMIFVTARIVNPDGLPVRISPNNGSFDFRR